MFCHPVLAKPQGFGNIKLAEPGLFAVNLGSMQREQIDQLLYFALMPFALLSCFIGISQAFSGSFFMFSSPSRELFLISEGLLLIGWIVQKDWLKSRHSDFTLRTFLIALLSALYAFIVPVRGGGF